MTETNKPNQILFSRVRQEVLSILDCTYSTARESSELDPENILIRRVDNRNVVRPTLELEKILPIGTPLELVETAEEIVNNDLPDALQPHVEIAYELGQKKSQQQQEIKCLQEQLQQKTQVAEKLAPDSQVIGDTISRVQREASAFRGKSFCWGTLGTIAGAFEIAQAQASFVARSPGKDIKIVLLCWASSLMTLLFLTVCVEFGVIRPLLNLLDDADENQKVPPLLVAISVTILLGSSIGLAIFRTEATSVNTDVSLVLINGLVLIVTSLATSWCFHAARKNDSNRSGLTKIGIGLKTEKKILESITEEIRLNKLKQVELEKEIKQTDRIYKKERQTALEEITGRSSSITHSLKEVSDKISDYHKNRRIRDARERVSDVKEEYSPRTNPLPDVKRRKKSEESDKTAQYSENEEEYNDAA